MQSARWNSLPFNVQCIQDTPFNYEKIVIVTTFSQTKEQKCGGRRIRIDNLTQHLYRTDSKSKVKNKRLHYASPIKLECVLRASAYTQGHLSFDELLNKCLHKRSFNNWRAKLWNICWLFEINEIVANQCGQSSRGSFLTLRKKKCAHLLNAYWRPQKWFRERVVANAFMCVQTLAWW